MGQSTDAILGFGWAGNEDEIEELGERDEDDGDISDLEDEETENDGVHEVDEPEDEESDWDIQQELEKEFGVDLNTHCSTESQMPYMFDSGSMVKANRGDPQAIETVHFRSSMGAESKRLNAALAWLWEKHPDMAERWQLPKTFKNLTWVICSDWN